MQTTSTHSPAYIRRRILWKAVNRQRAKFIPKVEKLWRGALRQLVDGLTDDVWAALRETYTMVGTPFAVKQFKELNRLKADDGSLTNTLNRRMELYVSDAMGNVASSIKDTTLAAAAEILADAEISEAEKFALLDDLIERRSKIIAQNEVAAASNKGRSLGASYFVDTNPGFAVFKTWIATIDDRIRDAHEFADGQTVREKEYFNVGGELLFAPHDPNGSPGNVINCRCTMDYFKQELRN